MEGETIKKKYMTILDMLKKERLTFGNQIEGLEAQLKKQEEEIEKLKVIHFAFKMNQQINQDVAAVTHFFCRKLTPLRLQLEIWPGKISTGAKWRCFQRQRIGNED